MKMRDLAYIVIGILCCSSHEVCCVETRSFLRVRGGSSEDRNRLWETFIEGGLRLVFRSAHVLPDIFEEEEFVGLRWASCWWSSQVFQLYIQSIYRTISDH